MTGKMVDKLTVYSGLATSPNPDSIVGMKNDIWATHHYNSTDKNPNTRNFQPVKSHGVSGRELSLHYPRKSR